MSHQLEILTENPNQWTPISLISPEILKKEIQPYVILALKEIEGNPDSRTSNLMNADKFSAIRFIVRHFARLRSSIKEPWVQADVQSFLENLRFSPECTTELSTLLCSERIYENNPKHLRVKPGIVSLLWKIDVSMGQAHKLKENTNEGNRKDVMLRDTSVLLIFSLTDGNTHTFRLSLAKFHELRFIVASALKSIIVLEKRKCMKKD